MTYHVISKAETEVLVGDAGGISLTKDPPEFILTTHATVDPGEDGGTTNTFVTAPIDVSRKGMNGKRITTFLNISGATSGDLRSAATEGFTFYTSIMGDLFQKHILYKDCELIK